MRATASHPDVLATFLSVASQYYQQQSSILSEAANIKYINAIYINTYIYKICTQHLCLYMHVYMDVVYATCIFTSVKQKVECNVFSFRYYVFVSPSMLRLIAFIHNERN